MPDPLTSRRRVLLDDQHVPPKAQAPPPVSRETAQEAKRAAEVARLRAAPSAGRLTVTQAKDLTRVVCVEGDRLQIGEAVYDIIRDPATKPPPGTPGTLGALDALILEREQMRREFADKRALADMDARIAAVRAQLDEDARRLAFPADDRWEGAQRRARQFARSGGDPENFGKSSARAEAWAAPYSRGELVSLPGASGLETGALVKLDPASGTVVPAANAREAVGIVVAPARNGEVTVRWGGVW
jgi:hypothetical protein